MTLSINHPDDLSIAAKELLTRKDRIILFYAEMGAGKTTFIRAICEALGVTDNVSSPTFSIVNEYNSPGGSVFHFDFYRLKNETEALDLGFEEYVHSGDYCLIEWPEKIPNLLPDNALKVRITITGEQQRDIQIGDK